MNVENDEENTPPVRTVRLLVPFTAKKGTLDHAPPAFCSAPEITDGVKDRQTIALTLRRNP
jgi:hypothetical protein